jgi:hypothetical protein
MEIRNRLYETGYKRTKVKEFFSAKSKRKYIRINGKHEITTVTGIPINKNGKPILNYYKNGIYTK